MSRKRLAIISTTLAILLGFSSVALADHEEPREEDTIVSFGYDELNHILALNSGDNDTPWVCNFADGALDATYIDILDGFFEIETLQSEGSDWEFDARAEHEVSEEYDAEEGTTPYAGADGTCGASGALVGGPNGQINHGQFMQAAKSLLGDMKGHGCIVREFAKSDIGKTESTKLRRGDVDESFEPGDSGQITFHTFEADCKKPNEKAEKPEKGERGRSSLAPGHNKGGE